MRPTMSIARDWRQRLAQRRALRRKRAVERSLASRHEEPVPLADPRFGRGARP